MIGLGGPNSRLGSIRKKLARPNGTGELNRLDLGPKRVALRAHSDPLEADDFGIGVKLFDSRFNSLRVV